MTISVLAALIIAVTLPLSYLFVKAISWAYEAREADSKELNHFIDVRKRYQKYFED